MSSILLTEGAIGGNLFDYVRESEKPELMKLISAVKKYGAEQRNSLSCTYDYRYMVDEVHGPSEIPISEVPARDTFVKENNRVVTQKWFMLQNHRLDSTILDVIGQRILKHYYPEVEVKFTFKYTLYEDGHFIENHVDGLNPGRVCGLIIYLSDEAEYNDGGGEIIITTNSNEKIEVKPVLGNFALLDFTQNNPEHEVKPVKNGFKRYSALTFVDIK